MMKITFNGYDFRDFIATEVSRPLPEFRESHTVISGADGESFDEITVGPREFGVTFVAHDKDSDAIQDAARKLMDVLAVRKPRPFTFSDEKDKDGNQLTRYAVPVGSFNADEFIRAGRWTCKFKQHDPYLYGRSRSVVLSANQAKSVDVGGNAPAWPITTSKPSGSKYYIQDGGGRAVVFKASFDGATTLTLDFERSKAGLSSSINAEGLQTGSRFFQIDGSVILKASHATTVSWYERWL